MRRTGIAVAGFVVLASCSGSRATTEAVPGSASPESGTVRFVGGNRYDKGSFVDDVGRTVLSFRLSVRNVGDGTGRSPDPRCHTTIDGERYELQIYENPELAPGERGWLRTGGPVPRLNPREFDNVEAYCEF